MRELFPYVTFAQAFTFGGWNLRRIAAQQWLTLGLLFVAQVLPLAIPPAQFGLNVTWLAMVPTLATAVRAVDPRFRMDARTAMGIVGIELLTFLGGAILALPFIVASELQQQGLATIVLIPTVGLALWLGIRFSLTAAVYAVGRPHGYGVFKAFYVSWQGVTGRTWWCAFWVTLTVGLMFGVPLWLLDGLILGNLGENALIPVGILNIVCTMILTMWINASYAGIALGTTDEPALRQTLDATSNL